MSLEQDQPPSLTPEDEEFANREYELHDFLRLRSLYAATRTIRHAERMLLTGIPSTLQRRFEDGTVTQLEVNESNVKLWKSLVFASITELAADGFKDVANSVIRRAIISEQK